MTENVVLSGRMLVAGEAAGRAMVLQAPLSLWHGLDAQTGSISEPGHPDRGACFAGTVLVVPAIKGATAGAGFTECLRRGHGPSAIVLTRADMSLVLASVVARELYDVRVPILLLGAESVAQICSGQLLRMKDGVLHRKAGSAL